MTSTLRNGYVRVEYFQLPEPNISSVNVLRVIPEGGTVELELVEEEENDETY